MCTHPMRACRVHRLPCQEACVCVMQRLQAGAGLAQRLVKACLLAADPLSAQVRTSAYIF